MVDNNPTTFCCCLTHLEALLELLDEVLVPGGQIVTDRVGLGWSLDVPGANPRWGFSFDDLAAAASLVGLRAFAVGGNLIVLAREEPARPGWRGELLHLLRWARRKAAGALRRLSR